MGRISFTIQGDKLILRKGAGSFSIPVRREADDAATSATEPVERKKVKRTFAEFCDHVDRTLSAEGDE
jgi:hypothetical protein